jgi:hypothetical protein
LARACAADSFRRCVVSRPASSERWPPLPKNGTSIPHSRQAAPVNSHFRFRLLLPGIATLPTLIGITSHAACLVMDIGRSCRVSGRIPPAFTVCICPLEALCRVHALSCAAGDAQAWLPNAAADSDPSG